MSWFGDSRTEETKAASLSGLQGQELPLLCYFSRVKSISRGPGIDGPVAERLDKVRLGGEQRRHWPHERKFFDPQSLSESRVNP